MLLTSLSTCRLHQGLAPGTNALCPVSRRQTCHRARSAAARCSAGKEDSPCNRRNLLLAGAAAPLLLLPGSEAQAAKLVIPATSLSRAQVNGEREALQSRVEAAVREQLGPGDAPACLRLLFNDAATYDAATGTGGVDGSIVLDEELSRPENADLKPLVAKLAKAKAKVDAECAKVGQPTVSWADMIVLAARRTAIDSFTAAKVAKSGEVGRMASFASPFPVVLGRKDATEPAPAGRVPLPDAGMAEIKDFLLKLGAKPSSGGPFGSLGAAKAPFWEKISILLWPATRPDPAAAEAELAASDAEFAKWSEDYKKSRRTVTRTNYEVDFANAFNKLAALGAKFDKEAYLYPITVDVPDKF